MPAACTSSAEVAPQLSTAVITERVCHAGWPAGLFRPTELFVLACLFYDPVARGCVHPASLWGGVVIAVSQSLCLAIANTDAWHAVAIWLTR
jgi:hypothetical protein